MRLRPAAGWDDPQFDPPPRFQAIERRLASLALDAWQSGGQAWVPGFDANSLVISDFRDAGVIDSIGAPVAAAFGLRPGMTIGGDGIMAELRAVCDLIALRSEPVPFEGSIVGPHRAVVLVRGVGLPIAAEGAGDCARIQVVVNWREVLDRAATALLRREILASLQVPGPNHPISEPFSVQKP